MLIVRKATKHNVARDILVNSLPWFLHINKADVIIAVLEMILVSSNYDLGIDPRSNT